MLHVAHYAKKTRIPRLQIEPPNAPPARVVVLPQKAVQNAPIVWPGNTKKPQARAKRFVPVVCQAITRIHPI